MADRDGIFARLGRLFDGGLAAINRENDREAHFIDQEIAKGEVALANGLNQAAAFLVKDVQGGESVHSAPQAHNTPTIPKHAKNPNTREM